MWQSSKAVGGHNDTFPYFVWLGLCLYNLKDPLSHLIFFFGKSCILLLHDTNINGVKTLHLPLLYDTNINSVNVAKWSEDTSPKAEHFSDPSIYVSLPTMKF